MKAAILCLLSGVALTIPPLVTAVERDVVPSESDRGESAPSRVRQVDVQTQTAAQLPVYIPPLRGAPTSRVGGASRGADAAPVSLEALAPDHTGLTAREQPTLYWYLSARSADPLEFTLIDEQGIKPLAEIRLDAPEAPGVQRIDLSKRDISLKPGVEYQWFVALVPDRAQRSNDVLAGGAIRRITLSTTLIAKLEHAPAPRLAHIYANEGLWYDAFAAVSGSIKNHPDDESLRVQRAALLEQVGLGEVAAQDVSFASYESGHPRSDVLAE